MTLENYSSTVLKQLAEAQNYPQVETIITDAVNQLANKSYPVIEYVNELERKIENLSPLVLSSTQFSCYRYALVYLHNYVVFPE
ncbi:hypothetical protein AQ505_17185 [Pedobacter sp. PACM 27299]|uniref:hypothetical protein n=1 Tax=Pedobacter sp. PACM 27299 TaxID=1727164 RepID=UPI00070642B0|nr:hypothetical protein [Pedobacter sp. PACM 27299]ALL07065.1 hypothetical protein AQ505_17185 [Pedobacter sp. PACM 27299]